MKKIGEYISKNKHLCLVAVSLLLLSPVYITVQAKNISEVAETNEDGKIQVTGTVFGESDKEPLMGVSVLVKGANYGVTTDVNGKFTVNIPYANATLVFSYIGYQPLEMNVEGRKELSVLMTESSTALKDVVIVGYTKQKKETLVGSVATLTTKDLTQSPAANITNALAGRLPGLISNQYSGGEAGVDKSEIFIRGKATYGNQAPIVIVDGVERDMSYLAPDEIETFTILKDASATAAYGIRGANGVIVVTTKRGQAQEKASVNFKASMGVNTPIKFPKYLGSADYAMLYNEAIKNDALMNNSTVNPSSLFSDEAINNFRNAIGDNSDGLGYNWDYFDFAFKEGIQQDMSLSIRGGSDRARYYVLAGMFSQGGNYNHEDLRVIQDKSTGFKRYNFRSNIDIDITKWLSARLDLGARITDRTSPGTSASRLITIAMTQPPYLPILVERNNHPLNEEYIAQNSNGMLYGDNIYRYNLLGELTRTGYTNERNTYLNGSFGMTLNMDFLTEGLKADVLFSYDASEGRWLQRKLDTYTEGYAEYPSYATFTPVGGSSVYMTPGHYTGSYKTGNKYSQDQTIGNGLTRNATEARTYLQARLDYARVFEKNHSISSMLLFNRSYRTVNNDLAYRYQGMTGRFAYGYMSKYLAEFNFGYNGSENFAPGKRYGFFPAVSAGWVISNESFMESSSTWLDHLKIRGSYGIVGSDYTSSRFPYISYYVGGDGYEFGQNFTGNNPGGIKEGGLVDDNLTWEKAQKVNLGFDANFLKQRLTLTVDLFTENRYDMIISLGDDRLGYPEIVGKDAPQVNAGKIRNHGFEFEIGWMDKIGENFKYYIKPNFTFARNKIKYIAEVERKNSWRQETGKRMYENYVYVFDHFVADQDEADRLNAINFQPWGKLIPGDVVYKDLDRNGVIDDEDRTAMGHPRSPEIQFGIPVGFQYKNFDFSVLFQGAANTSIQLNGASIYDFPIYDQDKVGAVKEIHLQRWTPETAATAKYPALHYGSHENNKNANSSLFLYDAKYIRLKNVEIGYHLPNRILRFFNFQQVRIYAQGLNLLTWDGLKDVDIDPETGNGWGNWYPIQKVFNFGIDVTF